MRFLSSTLRPFLDGRLTVVRRAMASNEQTLEKNDASWLSLENAKLKTKLSNNLVCEKQNTFSRLRFFVFVFFVCVCVCVCVDNFTCIV